MYPLIFIMCIVFRHPMIHLVAPANSAYHFDLMHLTRWVFLAEDISCRSKFLNLKFLTFAHQTPRDLGKIELRVGLYPTNLDQMIQIRTVDLSCADRTFIQVYY